MGKRSKRPGRTAGDIHATIKAQAEALRRAPAFGIRDADELPEVGGLMAAARRKIEAAMPSTFDHEGRTYYLRVRLMIALEIFDAPGAAAPLVKGLAASLEDFGHAPGH